MTLIMGDFNMKVYPAYGNYSLCEESNDNGKKMVDFALGRDLVVIRTWF